MGYRPEYFTVNKEEFSQNPMEKGCTMYFYVHASDGTF